MNFKKIGTLSLAAVLTFSIGTPAMASTNVYVTAASGLNIRKAPNTKTKAIATVPYGKKLVKINTKNGWDTIKYKNKIRYVSHKYVSPKPMFTRRSVAVKSASGFRRSGVIRWNGWRWTWYSSRVLPGGGLNIPGRHTDSNGYICDNNGYICLASGRLRKGTVVRTPFGKYGKVYDSGCAANTLDVYVNW